MRVLDELINKNFRLSHTAIFFGNVCKFIFPSLIFDIKNVFHIKNVQKRPLFYY